MASIFMNWRLSVGLVLAIVLDTAVQLFSKTAVVAVPDGDTVLETFGKVFTQPMFLVVAALMLCQLVNWLRVLKMVDVSFAKPFTSLSYVTVAIASAVLLEERLAPAQIAGIAIIILGVWCVSLTDAATAPDEEAGS